ncbi:MAG: PQQ-binding-like beta-propeller repeat protein [Deltaproteobacteria bacterium]|nr:PQQ-binding-like beta-propeller repeat protein [Deltaproteobacteria bacterium]
MLLLLSASLGACGACDDSTTIGTGRSRLSASTMVIDFGRVYVGTEAQRAFTLRVEGELAVLFGLGFGGDATGYAAGPASGVIRAGGEVAIGVLFRPDQPGPAQARLIVDSDATDNPRVVIELLGMGQAPPDCEDGNGCTVDAFDFESGICVHRAERLPCDDFNACTQGDTCVDGICLGESRSCDDQDACTDDLCDPVRGCEAVPTRSCDDHNPCTADLCAPGSGCDHPDLDDGTPCDDFLVCTTGDICFSGLCIGVNIPDGSQCDDGDPCSKNDQCLEGVCRDPTYHPPAVGELKFATEVGPLAPGASGNPIIDRDSTTYVGLASGVAAVDQCGEILWSVTTGAPSWSAATALPGLLVVPFGDRIADLDRGTGAVLKEVRLGSLFGALPIESSSTATSSARILDVAVRGSGALVVSLERTIEDRGALTTEGILAEVDRSHAVASLFRRLGSQRAIRVAIDRDESVIAVLREEGRAVERLVRFGLEGLPAGSWSTTASAAVPGELAVGAQGEVIWSQGMIAVSSAGALARIAPGERPPPFSSGSPVLRDAQVLYWSRPVSPELPPGPTLTGAGPRSTLLGNEAWELLALDLAPTRGATTAPVLWRGRLAGSAEASSPAVDRLGNVFVVARDATVSAFDPEGILLFRTALPVDGPRLERIALGISGEEVVTLAADGKVIGVRGLAELAISSWPRHRRDNLSTGHR